MSAFDTLAPDYDSDFTQQPIGKILRARVHERLLTHFSSGQHILEIGCGTGEDALFLAQKGIHITATDASEEMLRITAEKTVNQANVTVEYLNIADIEKPTPSPKSPSPNPRKETFNSESNHFDGVFSNFGALNCIDDWRPLAEYLSVHVKSGGKVCFGIMSPYCAWEFIWHALHWKWGIALRRLRGDDFGDLHISYPTIKHMTDDFSPYFKRINVMPLGLFLPTSALFDVVQKRAKLMNTLVNLEKRSENVSQIALFADHYWIEFERV